jgi:chromosome segregation protein
LYLSKLEIFGFKSFPEKTDIIFSGGVSAIVGPNGSGKSNIVDALRWVLGEQGDRALRSEKRDDVVFSGTNKRKPLSVAEVALTIQNNKNILPTEYSEVQIARRFFRSGDTEYYLNGTKVRLKDIRNLFVDTGIGPDAYSVIELKMVETILSHVKNERRKMFEEAAGIVSYKQNRDLTYKKLDSVKETLTRVNDIIREKQRNVSALERQARKNEEAKIVHNNLKILELVYYSFEYFKLQKEIQDIKDHEHENITLKQNLETGLSKSNENYDAIQPEIKSLEELSDSVNSELSEVKDEINILEGQVLVNNEKSKNLNNDIVRLNNEIDELEASLERNFTRETELSHKIETLKRTIEISEVSLIEKKSNVEKTIILIGEKKTELSVLGNKIKDNGKILTESKSEYDLNKYTLDNNLERMKSISESNSVILQELARFEKENYDNSNRIDKLLTERKSAEHELQSKTVKHSELTSLIESLKTEITNKTIELQNKINKVSYIENVIDNFEDYVEGIKHLKTGKYIDNVSTVIENIEVNEKYRIAVEVALGEVSNYLLLNDSRHLNGLINELSESDKGKVTFILNDKFTNQNYIPFEINKDYYNPEFINEAGVHGFADSFIKCKNREYEFVLRYLLDEYIIVDSPDIAFKLSADNYYKFITIDGDIITRNVVRTGGKTKEETLKLGRENQVLKLKAEIDINGPELDGLKHKLNEYESVLNSLDIERYQENLNKMNKELSDLQNQASILAFKINESNKNAALNDETYNKLRIENTDIDFRINGLIDKLNKAENIQANYEKELTFLTEEFTEIDIKHTQNQSDYSSFLIEFNKLKNEFKNEESNLNRILSSIENQKNQIKKNKLRIEEQDNALLGVNRLINEYKSKINSLREKYNVINNRVNDVETQLDKKKSEREKIENEQRVMRKDFDRISRVLMDSQIKIAEYEIKSDNYKELLTKKYEVDLDNFPEDLNSDISGMKKSYTDDSGIFDEYTAKKDIDELSEQLKKLGGGFQQIIWDDFQNEKDELEKMISQRDDLFESEKDIKKTIEKINNEAKERFLQTFEQIRQNFIRIFKELFQEGDEANLKLVYEEDEDGKVSEDPLEAKIEITAKPRGKRPTSIELLSGGEKTLTAIALLFAIYLVKPSPFCVLDEVDAPLDVANLARFNRMIRKFSEKTQFILITHNERTMETVDTLYGVTMQEPGVTTIVETRFRK